MIHERMKCEMAKQGEALPWRTPSGEQRDWRNMAAGTGAEWRMNVFLGMGGNPLTKASPNNTTCDCFVLITKKLVISGFVRLKSFHPFGLPFFSFPPPPPPKKKRNSPLLVTRSVLSVTVWVRTVVLETSYCSVCGSRQRPVQDFRSDLSLVYRTSAFVLFPEIIEQTSWMQGVWYAGYNCTRKGLTIYKTLDCVSNIQCTCFLTAWWR
jgi:hypothetical protein